MLGDEINKFNLIKKIHFKKKDIYQKKQIKKVLRGLNHKKKKLKQARVNFIKSG